MSFKSKAIDAIVKAFILSISAWAKAWSEDAFFFIVIGDKHGTDVAWHNTDRLQTEGAWVIADVPEAAARFDLIADGVNILTEENLKKKKYQKAYHKFETPSPDDEGWHSFDFGDEEDDHRPSTNDHRLTTND